MKNGSECNPGGCHGLQSRCSDENWEVGSIPTRFRNNYMLILVASFFTLSFISAQGMYIDKIDKPVYSLNITFDSFNDIKIVGNGDEIDDNEKHYGLSLSSVFKGNNEISLGYKSNEDSKIINTSYLYYIKPDFYLNMFSGISYEYIQKSSDINENKYNVKLGIYGNKRNAKNVKLGLQYFPFFIYDYVLHEIPTNAILGECTECYYDIITLGCSFLFNDIGIESSYSWIDKNTNQLSLKIYLWEFGN